MGVEKMSLSFDLELGEEIRASAAETHQSVSAWMADAARDRLRLAALAHAVTAFEDRYGALTEDEHAAADDILARADERRGAA